MSDDRTHANPLGLSHRRARRPAAAGRLQRSGRRRLAGVAAGVAEFVGASPTLLRWLWLVSLPLTGGISAVAYLLLWVMLPGPGNGSGEPGRMAGSPPGTGADSRPG